MTDRPAAGSSAAPRGAADPGVAPPGSALLTHPRADLFVPDGAAAPAALERTTDLGIGAHADDLEVLAYPAIEACFGESGRWFGGIVVTDGVGGPSLDAEDAQTLFERRRREQRAAASTGDYAFAAQLAHPSGAVKESAGDDAVADLVALLRATRPSTLWLHNPADRHETHVAVLQRTLEAVHRLEPRERPQRALGLEVWRDLDWLCGPDRIELPVGRRPHLARALIALYDSQIASGKRYDLAVEGRRRAHATFADSHGTDAAEGVCLALDLTVCLDPAGPTPEQRVHEALDRMRDDVRSRLRRHTR